MSRPALGALRLLARTKWGWRLVHSVSRRRDPTQQHQIDRTYGIDTSGHLPPLLIDPAAKPDGEVMPYSGCQPSCIRAALSSLPDTREATFYDLGCGKGRALFIASEYPFRAIVGIELSRHLVEQANANIDSFSSRHPGRPPIRVVQSNVTDHAFDEGEIVVFLYHSIGRTTLASVLARLELRPDSSPTTIVYENPVNGDLVDASAKFSRWFGEQVSLTQDERLTAPDEDEGIVVWRSKGVGNTVADRDTRFDIVITKPGWRAVVMSP